MTIPRSDNPAPIEFADIRVGDTVEERTDDGNFSETIRFVVAGTSQDSIVGVGSIRIFYAGSQSLWFLHHRPVALPDIPTFGRLTWTTDMAHSVVAEWHSAHVFGSSNPMYAVSDLGHQIPRDRVTKWEPGEFVPAGEGRIAANASCTPYCSSGGAL